MLNTELNIQQAVKIHKALGESTRFRIVQVLLNKGEVCCSEIGQHMASASLSTLSHQLKQLSDCGLLTFRKEGTYIYYQIDRPTIQKYAAYLLE